MGVQGLSSYIKKNSSTLLTTHKLSNCQVVIDGSNLMYDLCGLRDLHCVFGGDYAKYAKSIRQFINSLLKCNVKPFVVFDGATCIKPVRMKRKLLRAGRINPRKNGKQNQFYLPLLAKLTLVKVLVELKVSYVQCEFEADQQIATIARLLECPVMSNDTDFFILNVNVVPLDTLEIQPVSTDDGVLYHLNCKMYEVKKLLAHFDDFPCELLPLMATLVGNDMMPKYVCQRLYAELPKRGMHKFSEQHKRIIGLFARFHHTDLNTAISMVLKCVKKPDRPEISKMIRSSVKWYLDENISVLPYLSITVSKNSEDDAIKNKWYDLLQKEETVNTEDSRDTDVETEILDEQEPAGDTDSSCETYAANTNLFWHKDGLHHRNCNIIPAIPKWFLANYSQHQYPSYFWNILHKNIFVLEPMVESNDLPCAQKCSLHILKVISGLLLAHNHESFEETSSCYKKQKVVYYMRNHSNIYTNNLSVTFSLPKYGILPTLSELEILSIDKKRQIFHEALNLEDADTEFISEFPEWLQLVICIVLYWLKLPYPFVSDYNLSALLVSLIFHSLKSNTFFETSDSDGSIKVVKELHPFTEMSEQFDSYYDHFNKKNVHIFAMLQSCFFHTFYLNALLDFPYPKGDPVELFHGTFMYNLTCELQKRSNPWMYIDTLLSYNSVVRQWFHDTHDKLVSGIKLSELWFLKNKIGLKAYQRKKKSARNSNIPTVLDELANLEI